MREGSAFISIVVAVASRDQGHDVDLLCQLNPESLHWVGTAKVKRLIYLNKVVMKNSFQNLPT